ncbi:MAG: endonuclease/exonuclease/phosphatase family protein [Chitinophagaceae bacterium]|nr:endonuclease/exonuclease/phosphatase family protein [Chitinophagaceae bacterium]
MPKSLFRRLTKKFFIITNLIIAVLFLLGCYASWFNPNTFWFLGLLTLSAFYLLLLLLCFILFWLFVKPFWCIISVLTITLAYKPVSNIFPFRISANFSKQKSQSAIRVMSWNVEHFDILEHKTHPEKKEQMIGLINDYAPDIVLFQEMVGGDKNENAINYVPNFAQQLSMPEYHYSYNPKLDFDGNHHFGIIIFSKYPIINKQTVGTYPNDYNSIFQYADIVKDTDTVRVFNLHLQSLRFSSTNLQYIEKPTVKDEKDIKETKNIVYKLKTGFLKRKIQADRINEEIAKSPYPVIVCGDFNDVPNSYAYCTVGKNLQNAFVQKGAGIGRTFNAISPTLRIDNIFADKRFTVLQYTSNKKNLVDHYPVIADLQLNK